MRSGWKTICILPVALLLAWVPLGTAPSRADDCRPGPLARTVAFLEQLLPGRRPPANTPRAAPEVFPTEVAGRPLLDAARESTLGLNSPYRIIGSIRGDHGGMLHVLQLRPGETSWYHRDQDPFRGSPEWIVEMLGVRAASFLGIRRVSRTMFLVPDARELQNALDAYNLEVPPADRIELGFYEPALDRVSDTDYFGEFTTHGLHPVAAHGRESVHDVHFHLMGIALPPQALAYLRRQYAAVLEFRALLHERGLDGEPFYLSSLSYGTRLDSEIASLAKSIDASTGGVVTALHPEFPRELSGIDRLADGTFAHWTLSRFSFRESPAAFLSDNILRRFDGSHTPRVGALLDEFIQSRTLADPDFSTASPLTQRWLDQEIRRRITAIRSHLERLERERVNRTRQER